MKKLLRTIRILRRIARCKPVIVLNNSGQLTEHPKVHLVIKGAFGAMSIFTEPDNSQGNATVKLHSMTIHDLTGLPVVDVRRG